MISPVLNKFRPVSTNYQQDVALGQSPLAESDALSKKLKEAVQAYEEEFRKATNPSNPILGPSAWNSRSIEGKPKNAADMLLLSKGLESAWNTPVKKMGQTTQKLLKSIQQYGPVVDAVIRLAPVPISGIVWGSVKLAMSDAIAWLDQIEVIANTFADLERWLPEVNIYEPFAREDSRVNGALVTFQISLVRFFTLVVRKAPVKGFINALFNQFQNDHQKIRDSLSKDAESLRNIALAVEARNAHQFRHQQQIRDFMAWLAPHQSKQTWLAPNEKVKEQVFGSIFHHEAMNKWWDSENNTLLSLIEITGPDGCGKSSLAAAIADQLKTLYQTDVTCVIFENGYPGSGCDVACTIILQILGDKPELLCSEILNLRDYKTSHASMEACTKIYRILARSLSRIYVILDAGSSYAIKECIDMVSSVTTAALDSSSTAQFRFLAMQPRYSSIKRNVPITYDTASIQIDAEAIRNDIESFASISGKSIAEKHTKNKQERQILADEISRALIREGSSNFKLLRAKIDFLFLQPTLKDLRAALPPLPPEVQLLHLEVLKVLQGYKDGRTKLALETLKTAMGSFRALEIEEFRTILTVDLGTCTIDRSLAPDPAQTEQIMLDLLRTFVALDNHQVQLTSYSTKEFLGALLVRDSEGAISFRLDESPVPAQEKQLRQLAKESMAMKCLVYLSLPDFSGDNAPLPALGDETAWRAQFPFFEYASNAWLNHLHDLANYLKNPDKGWRKELGFPPNVLEALGTFLHSRGCWTFLEGKILFSSVQETQEAIHVLEYPIKEIGAYTEKWLGPEGIVNKHGDALQDWIGNIRGILDWMETELTNSNIEDETIRKGFILRAIRMCRSSSSLSLTDKGAKEGVVQCWKTVTESTTWLQAVTTSRS